MTLNDVRKAYKNGKSLYACIGDIIEILKTKDEQEIRKIGLYFGISWKEFSVYKKYSKSRIDQDVFTAIVCGVLDIEHYLLKNNDYDIPKIVQIKNKIYSYKHKGLIDIYRTSFGNRYISGSFAVDLTK